jgi:hypothetical protein
MHERIEQFGKSIETVKDAWVKIYNRLSTSSLDVDHRYPRLAHSSLRELNRRVMGTLEALGTIPHLDEVAESFVLPKLDALNSTTKTMRTALTTLEGQLSSQPDTQISDPNGNLDPAHFSRGGSAVAQHPMGPLLDQVNVSANTLWDAYALLRITRNRALPALVARSARLQELYDGHSALLVDATEKHASLVASTVDATKAAAETTANAAAAKAQADEAKASAKEAQASAAEALAKLERVREVATQANSLQTQVDGFSGQFDGFQKAMDSRLALLAQFEAEANAARTENAARDAEIERLTKAADAMIQGASTAGLGYTLEQTRKLYASRMFWARVWFGISILFLAASAIPLAAQLLPGLFKEWLPVALPNAGAKGPDELYLLLGKVFLLFPATWLTQFFSKSFSEFFHLEREYAHKAALAQSVEGFKRQAPNYEQEMTAEVFREVTSNPSKQAAPDPAAHPLYDVLAKKLVNLLPGGSKAAPKAD